MIKKSQSSSRFNLLFFMIIIALGYFALTRLALLAFSFSQAEPSGLQFLTFNLIGLVYDVAFLSYAAIPFIFYLALMPNRFWSGRINRTITHLFALLVLYGMGFVAVAEWLFWDEFNVRFNFISVDYLVYRREVTNNIVESYPLFTMLSVILGVTLTLYFSVVRKRINKALQAKESFSKRLVFSGGYLLLPVIAFFGLGQSLHSFSTNNYLNELASDGPYQFFAAFRNNELDYNSFYRTLPDEEASTLLKEVVFEKNNLKNSGNALYALNRKVINEGAEKRLNVVLIMVESLSAKFLGSFGSEEKLTPYLDKLSKESLFFDHFYATGTRTTRGLEAVTLSIPPTPGRSIVKRLGREKDLWSLGHVLKEKGYNTKFIYGGHGYFDNMNEFFSGNGYGIIDQSDIPEEKVKFANAWGISDEDLFTATIKEADRSSKAGKPFFFHLMTTSNHRPYTYPEGRIDIPSGTGRYGAVKYTDWAIGDFIEKARKTSWFKETIFVIVADHCAGSAGKTTLPLKKYHIPLFIYSPAQLTAQKINKISSQIDIAPTLLAMMNMNYESYAFCKNIFSMRASEERALIGNYQHLGLYEGGKLSILSPRKKMSTQMNLGSDEPTVVQLSEPSVLMKKTIAYYQGSSYIYQHRMNSTENDENR